MNHHYIIYITGGVLQDVLFFMDDKRALNAFNDLTDSEYADEYDPFQAFLDDGGNDGDDEIHWVVRDANDTSPQIY